MIAIILFCTIPFFINGQSTLGYEVNTRYSSYKVDKEGRMYDWKGVTPNYAKEIAESQAASEARKAYDAEQRRRTEAQASIANAWNAFNTYLQSSGLPINGQNYNYYKRKAISLGISEAAFDNRYGHLDTEKIERQRAAQQYAEKIQRSINQRDYDLAVERDLNGVDPRTALKSLSDAGPLGNNDYIRLRRMYRHAQLGDDRNFYSQYSSLSSTAYNVYKEELLAYKALLNVQNMRFGAVETLYSASSFNSYQDFSYLMCALTYQNKFSEALSLLDKYGPAFRELDDIKDELEQKLLAITTGIGTKDDAIYLLDYVKVRRNRKDKKDYANVFLLNIALAFDPSNLDLREFRYNINNELYAFKAMLEDEKHF